MFKFITLKNNIITHNNVEELAKKVNSFTGIKNFDLIKNTLTKRNNAPLEKEGVAFIHIGKSIILDEDGDEWITIHHLEERYDPVYSYILEDNPYHESIIISFSLLPEGFEKAEDDEKYFKYPSYHPKESLFYFEGKYYLPKNKVYIFEIFNEKFKIIKIMPKIMAEKSYKKIGLLLKPLVQNGFLNLKINTEGTGVNSAYIDNFVEKQDELYSQEIYGTNDCKRNITKILYKELQKQAIAKENKYKFKKQKKQKTKKYYYGRDLSVGDIIHQNNFTNIIMGGFSIFNSTQKLSTKKGVAYFDWRLDDKEYPEFNFDFSFKKKLENGVNLIVDEDILNFLQKKTEELPKIVIPELIIPDDTVLDWNKKYTESCYEVYDVYDEYDIDEINTPEFNFKVGDFDVNVSICDNADEEDIKDQTGTLVLVANYKKYYKNIKYFEFGTIQVGDELPKTYGELVAFEANKNNEKLQKLLSLRAEGEKNEKGEYIKKTNLENQEKNEILQEIKEDKIFFYDSKKLIYNRIKIERLDEDNLCYRFYGNKEAVKEIKKRLIGSCHILAESNSSGDIKTRGYFGRLNDCPKDAIVVYPHTAECYLDIYLSDIPGELITLSNKKNVIINRKLSLRWYTKN
jgi:hypothetical protein